MIYLNRLGVSMHTFARIQVDGTDTGKVNVEECTYGKGGVHAEVNIFSGNMVCVFIGSIDTYQY
jgi:hypothetical protein